MRLWWGLRIALAGGRGSIARLALMTGGVTLGVLLLLLGLTVLPALQGRIDRYAWHRTDAATPASAPDPALWLAVTDYHAGEMVVRVQIAALGPRPPVPPGLDRLPGPGEVVVSPALGRLFETTAADQLRDRFPGRVTGTIGPDGLVSPDELVAVVGRTPDELRATTGAYEIRGFERPGEPIDLRSVLRVAVAMVAALLIGPVVVFVAMVTRIGAAGRERRFAAIRLAGATRCQTGVLAATESALAALGGTLLGLCGYLVVRPLLAGQLRYEGMRFPLDDLAAPAGQVVLVLLGVPLLAVASTLVGLRRVQITPLGVHRRVRPRPPRAWRLVPLAAGIAGIGIAESLAEQPEAVDAPLRLALNLGSPLAILVGMVLAGPWACRWISRGLARLSRRATTLIAARRIAADPYTAFRAVGGVAVGAFVLTTIGQATMFPAAPSQSHSGLAPGVVAVQVAGASEAELAPLLRDGVVVARSGGPWTLVVGCAELARVTTLGCPLPVRVDAEPVRGLFGPGGFAEPGPDAARLPAQLLLVPTDGTPAAQERVRTLVAATLPHALARTDADFVRDDAARLAGVEAAYWLGLLFVLLVAAASLTISVISGLLERRRPFALLRASGVGLGELRRIALLESAVPLVCTAVGGIAVALLVGYVVAPDEFVLPDVDFFVAVGGAALVAFTVCLAALPLMDAATRHDSIRFE